MAQSGASMKWGGLDKALDKLQGAFAAPKALMESLGGALVSGTLERFKKEDLITHDNQPLFKMHGI
ncbi:MAG: hypothetical protein LBQ10_07345 [Desulfovibrio sp.]|jgi:hypothetical protein|nr:hypothetical protein [Desulfovibrio sp.]